MLGYAHRRGEQPGGGTATDFHARIQAHKHHLVAAKDLIDYPRQLSLDVDRFTDELRTHAWRDRIAADIESADLSEVAGTPSFFVNGHRQPGPYDIATLNRAVRTARGRTTIPPLTTNPSQ